MRYEICNQVKDIVNIIKMSIQQDVHELRSLDVEMKRLRKHIKLLKDQKDKCEKRILEYLETNQQPGLKHENTVIMAQERKKRRYEKKTSKIIKGESILDKYGIPNTKEILEELLEAMRGSPQTVSTLKIY